MAYFRCDSGKLMQVSQGTFYADVTNKTKITLGFKPKFLWIINGTKSSASAQHTINAYSMYVEEWNNAVVLVNGSTGITNVAIPNTTANRVNSIDNDGFTYGRVSNTRNFCIYYAFGEVEDSIEILTYPMTSHYAPSGRVRASSEYSTTFPAWKAFDNNATSTNDFWRPDDSDTSPWLEYDIGESKVLKIVDIYGITNRASVCDILASNDETTYTRIASNISVPSAASVTVYLDDNYTKYRYYKFEFTKTGTNAPAIGYILMSGY